MCFFISAPLDAEDRAFTRTWSAVPNDTQFSKEGIKFLLSLMVTLAVKDLEARGVKEVGLHITDWHRAMLNALAAKFLGAQRQRCVKHKMSNVLSYLPTKHRDAIGQELRAMFYQESREEAEQLALAFCEKYRREHPSEAGHTPKAG